MESAIELNTSDNQFSSKSFILQESKEKSEYLSNLNEIIEKNKSIQHQLKETLASINLSISTNIKAQNVNKALLRNRKEFHREARPRQASIITNSNQPCSLTSHIQTSFWNIEETTPELTNESKMLLTLKKFMPASYKFSFLWRKEENSKLCMAILSLAQKRINEKLIMKLEKSEIMASVTFKCVENAMIKIKNFTIESPEVVQMVQAFDAKDWENISKGILGRTSNECKLQWNCFIKSDINSKNFSTEEIAKIKEIAAKHNHRNWVQISKEIGTGKHPAAYLRFFKQNLSNEIYKWSKEETRRLIDLYNEKGTEGLREISRELNRDIRSVETHLENCLNQTMQHGKWSLEEDHRLLKAVLDFGLNWEKIAKKVETRNKKQCKDRYIYHYSPAIDKASMWTMEEEIKLEKMAKEHMELYGRIKWSKLSQRGKNFYGKTSRNLVDKWNSMLRKKLT